MQMFDIYETREAYEDRIAQLKKDYEPSKGDSARKPLQWIKKVFKREKA